VSVACSLLNAISGIYRLFHAKAYGERGSFRSAPIDIRIFSLELLHVDDVLSGEKQMALYYHTGEDLKKELKRESVRRASLAAGAAAAAVPSNSTATDSGGGNEESDKHASSVAKDFERMMGVPLHAANKLDIKDKDSNTKRTSVIGSDDVRWHPQINPLAVKHSSVTSVEKKESA
jgi:hypothetical protein